MATEEKSGLLDLEKELTCAICTEILYQPLTLLNCLHTFCGSCLKEWFSWQATAAASSGATDKTPYNCPSCREIVIGTKHNATVTTLLDMFMRANPDKGRSEEEKADIAKRYKSGDDVLPKFRKREATAEEENDRRLLQEVADLSLREVGIQGNSDRLDVRDRRRGQRSRDQSRESRQVQGGLESRQRRHREEDRSRRRDGSRNTPSRATDEGQPPSRPRAAARQIEHQSSLRSLISTSDVESSEMEEEIVRQILEEGLLNGIDVENMSVAQADELSERIAEAYRRRQREVAAAHTPSNPSIMSRPVIQPSSSDRPRHRAHSRSHSAATRVADLARTTSEQGTLAVGPPFEQRARRLSSNARVEASRTPSSPKRPSVEVGVGKPAGRASTEPTDKLRSSNAPSRNTSLPLSDSAQRGTDSEQRRAPDLSRITAQADPSASPSTQTSLSPHSSSHLEPGAERPSVSSRHHSPSSSASRPRTTLYPEPSIDCDRCGKKHIEYELHTFCSKCNNGEYHLCLSCYRQGRGCLYWLGFGDAAWRRYESENPKGPPPHYLEGHRYVRPSHPLVPPPSNDINKRPLSSEDPAKRLQAGLFCDNCLEHANACFWKCSVCNEGEWGFCNRCLNEGKHCTHPLLPLTNLGGGSSGSQPHDRHNKADTTSPAPPSLLPPHSSLLHPPSVPASDPLQPLTFSPPCAICSYPIQPSNTRFHCPTCSHDTASDYNIHVACYQRLVRQSVISAANGPKGWRRCPNGHRMAAVGFQDGEHGQLRLVTQDLVGGHALDGKDTLGETEKAAAATAAAVSTTSATRTGTGTEGEDGDNQAPLPPDGGTGWYVRAKWSYWPPEGEQDELAFPKWAEIREVVVLNEEWMWGVYMGAKGVFSSRFVSRVKEVT